MSVADLGEGRGWSESSKKFWGSMPPGPSRILADGLSMYYLAHISSIPLSLFKNRYAPVYRSSMNMPRYSKFVVDIHCLYYLHLCLMYTCTIVNHPGLQLKLELLHSTRGWGFRSRAYTRDVVKGDKASQC